MDGRVSYVHGRAKLHWYPLTHFLKTKHDRAYRRHDCVKSHCYQSINLLFLILGEVDLQPVMNA